MIKKLFLNGCSFIWIRSLHENKCLLCITASYSLIFTSLFPPAPPSLSAGPSFWGETAVVSQWTESNPSNSDGCEIGLEMRLCVERGGVKKIGTASSSMFGWVYTIGCSDETQHFVVLLKKESCSLRKKNALWLIIERPCIITPDIKVCPCCGGYLVLRSCEKFTVLHFLDGNSSSVGDVKWPVRAWE